MKLRKARQARRGRIEIIPMIDVMFFLLATFMLASLSLQNLHSLPVNLPQGQAQALSGKLPIVLTVRADGSLLLGTQPVTLANLAPALKNMLLQAPASVVVAADRAAPSGVTVQAMLQARAAGAQHFQIAVQHAP